MINAAVYTAAAVRFFYASNPTAAANAVQRAFRVEGVAASCRPLQYGGVLVTADWRGPFMFVPVYRSPAAARLN